MRKRTLIIAALASPQGQNAIKKLYRKLDTPQNREKASKFLADLRGKAVKFKDDHQEDIDKTVNVVKTNVNKAAKKGEDLSGKLKEKRNTNPGPDNPDDTKPANPDNTAGSAPKHVDS